MQASPAHLAKSVRDPSGSPSRTPRQVPPDPLAKPAGNPFRTPARHPRGPVPSPSRTPSDPAPGAR
jgi:hypothetical protein